MSPADLSITYRHSLLGLSTFGIDAIARCLVTVTEPRQLALLPHTPGIPGPLQILGGGSNILITADVEGSVLLNKIGGISILREDRDDVWLRAGAGVVWHDLVLFAIERGWGGIENLALIPGTVGAAPIQNIGAYGVEVKDVISEVETWNWDAAAFHSYNNEACRFGYRDSIFKTEIKGKMVVTSVTFRLSKKPALHTEYGAIREELETMKAEPSVLSIANAVMNIRRSKLPDPAVIGNAGSFFKNPVIDQGKYASLKMEFPNMPGYPAAEGFVKVPAGWLIEQCGWKGFRRGDAGVHAKQALVLVNYGGADGAAIWQLSTDVLESVQAKFGILLEREVQVW